MENTPASPLSVSGSHSWEQLREIIDSLTEQMKETGRRMQETDQLFKETDRRMQETDRLFKETAQQMKETDRRIQENEQEFQKTKKEFQENLASYRKETDRRIQENDRLIQEHDRQLQESRVEFRKQIKEITNRFLSQSGHIVEGLMEPSALNLFKDLGFNIVGCWKEMKATNKQTQRRMEVDLFYHDTTEAVAVEVKIKCEKEDVDHFLEQMSHFKEVFPRYADVNVYAAIAAINYNRDADQYAAEKGLFVIRVSDNDVFSLDPTQKETRVYF